MMELVPFKAEHFYLLDEQSATAYLRPIMTRQMLEALEGPGLSFTGMVGEKVVFCAGVAPYYSNRGEAWALIDQKCRDQFIHVHRHVKRYLDVCPIPRVEAAVDIEFENGHRWMRLLGFELEAPRLRGYRPGGGDCALYARVRARA